MQLARSLTVFLPAVAVLGGCGGGSYTFAPVSGRVTLNGQPLADAYVEFQPAAPSRDADPGPGSIGKTDQDGRYALHSQLDEGQRGAVVGKHKVRVSMGTEEPGAEDRDADPTGPRRKKSNAPFIPGKYNVQTELTFDVPAGGTDQANFDLKSR